MQGAIGFDGANEMTEGIPRVLVTSLIRPEIKNILKTDTL
jgi:hypothetical protein